jgi:L-serine deaminase
MKSGDNTPFGRLVLGAPGDETTKHKPLTGERTLRILVVDDSEDDVMLLRHELLGHGIRFEYLRVDADSPMREALADDDWDIVICDHNMPGFDSLCALDVLKTSGKDIPFILYSGHICDEQAFMAMNQGVADYVPKGNIARLVPVIERELRGAAMREAVNRGLDARESPGVHRRARIAPERAARLADAATPAHERCAILALAAAERNAAGASVVAAPSNGAGGTVAGVLVHALDARPESADARAVDFLATAGAVGALLRAQGLRQVGCQGEIGVASAMAAAGYTAVLGGTPHQILHAAETALKAHLGLGCDPHNGRIETPCIDRCETAAASACTAALAAVRVSSPPIALERVAASMIESGRALAGRFKQASLGGIALSVPDC